MGGLTASSSVYRFSALLLMAALTGAAHGVSAQSSGAAGVPSTGGGGGGGSAGIRLDVPAELVNDDRIIPANGSFLISTRRTKLGPVTLVDDRGNSFSGSSRELLGYVVWTPDRPLEPGRTHTLTIAPYSPGSATNAVYSIEVSEAWTPARPEITSMLERKRAEYASNKCCVGPGAHGCLGNEVDVYISVDIDLATKASNSVLTQVLFGSSVGAPDTSPVIYSYYPLREFNALEGWSSNGALSEYCATVEAVEIGSGTKYLYPDLEPRCIAHGDFGKIGTMLAQPTDAQLKRDNCGTPPVGYEQRWCQANRECGSNDGWSNCESYAPLCAAFADAGVIDGGREVDASIKTEPDAGKKPRASSSRKRNDGGCSVRAGVGGPPGNGRYVFAALCLGAALRARKRRASARFALVG